MTDADMLAEARIRRSAMEEVRERDAVSRILSPLLDEALNGLEDGEED